MHDRARIAVCRGAFLVLCVVPTLLTACYIAFHWLSVRSPAAKAEWERELSQRLGVAVAIDNLSYPQPALAELSSVKLADRETKLLLAQCRRVEIERLPEAWQVTLVEPAIARGALPALVRRFHERAFAAAVKQAPPIRISATQLILEGDNEAQGLAQLAALWEATSAGPALTLHFALPADEQSPIEVRITRNQQLTPPATQIEWNCPAPLPVSLAAGFAPDLAGLGQQATVSGSGGLLWESGSVRGKLTGEIRGIDLSRLIGERFPHLLTGQANLKLDEAALDGGRLTSVRGTLVTSGGRISRSLVAAAAEHLALDAEMPPEEEESARYRKLALRFELTDQALHLAGIDDSQPALVTTDAGPLLSAPQEHQVPAVALVRMLVPDSQVQVPATKQTAALLRIIPLPAVELSELARKSSHTPTRLGPASPADRSANPIREGSLR
jgi:hypothetical protein